MADAQFVINGREYPVHGIDTFDMAEAMVLYEYSKLTIDQVEDLEGLHPGVVAALMHVAMARAHPEMKAKDIRAIVNASNLLEIVESLAASMQEADAVDPPAEPLPSESDSSSSSGESERSSGASSTSDSEDPPDTNLRAIGGLG